MEIDGLPSEIAVQLAQALLKQVCPPAHCALCVQGAHEPLMHALVPHCELLVHAPHTPETQA
jgi:hypothetical protein